MTVSFGGFGENVLTLECSSVIEAGTPVTISSGGKAVPCEEEDKVAGVCIGSDGSYAAVQLTGVVTLPYSGDAPSPGFVTLLADGEGGVAADGDGREHLALEVDTTSETVTFIL